MYYRITAYWRNFWYGRVTRRHWLIKTKLPKNAWIDSDERILYAVMAILEEFYEKEISLNIVDWDSEETHRNVKAELDAVLAWWRNYPTRKQEIAQILTQWSNSLTPNLDDDFLEALNTQQSPESQALFDRLHEAERILDEEEQTMLNKVITYRHYMWT